MKKLLAVSIIIFSVFMSYVVIGGFLQKQQKESAAENNTTTPATTTAPAASGATTKTYSASEVSTHSSTSDCWLIINNNVYDVSSFLAEHPGGAATIIPYCGKEATKAFDTQDRGSGGGHSSNATSMLASYQIGTLK